MSNQAYYITTAELAARGRDKIPSPLKSSAHLIYSSPATLAFNSPGAEGFGVKRAGLSVPGSVMLIVSPGCCGRNTSLVSRMPEYRNRFFYLNLEEKDVITGRHLDKIPQAAKEILEFLDVKPSVLMICITCADALLGTDMERVCRKTEEAAGISVRPCYMYALTREGSRPPMMHVRQTLCSLLEPMSRKKESANILGYFSPLDKNCELYALLKSAGIQNIREISGCGNYSEFLKMAEANFNLLLNPEGRFAANDLTEKLGIPYIELTRIYDIERSEKQYTALSKALGTNFKTDDFREAAIQARQNFCGKYKGLRLGIGECLNADSFELALAMVRAGLNVSEIYGTVTAGNFVWIRALAQLSPETKVFSNLEPTMLYYEGTDSDVEFALGKDACYYHAEKPGLNWNSDIQPFGFSAAETLFKAMDAEMNLSSDSARHLAGAGMPTEKKKNSVYPNKNETIYLNKTESGCINSARSAQFKSGNQPAYRKNSAAAQHSGVKNLRKFLTPFAPDQSGAVSVLYELGGIIVILDAGGCAGNICGFDEPRWAGRKSAIFSAGLRDMDAIMGSDEKLAAKIRDAASKIKANFIALVGTPVPAMIATDYYALKKKLEPETGLPVLIIDTNGMELYDRGAEKAWSAVFNEFAKEKLKSIPGKINIIGETPQDAIFLKETGINSDPDAKTLTADDSLPYNSDPAQLSGEIWNLPRKLPENPAQAYPKSSVLTLNDIKNAAEAELNIITSPSAVKAAKLLKERFGTPYEIVCPNAKKILPDMDFSDKNILIVHQHVFADTLRKELLHRGAAGVTCAGWFMFADEIRHEDDIFLKEESDFTCLLSGGSFDIIIADNALIPLAGNWSGLWIDAPHFALSGSVRPAGQVQGIGPEGISSEAFFDSIQGDAQMPELITKKFQVYGIVQGVGFRPTVSRHAAAAGIAGSVSNKGPYVEIYAQGSAGSVEKFRQLLEEEPPARSVILKIKEYPTDETPVFDEFSIIESEKTKGEIYISPDIAICEDCRREMYDPGNKRYLHPFINCTNCGPRMTILDSLPYDRERTSMKEFPMCPDCASEYVNPENRRFDAQPVCCNACGPEVYILNDKSAAICRYRTARQTDPAYGHKDHIPDFKGNAMDTTPEHKHERHVPNRNDNDMKPAAVTGLKSHVPNHKGNVMETAAARGREAIIYARKIIAEGGIAAIKGIGGFHLCCDALNSEAVSLLRNRKNRPMKPFAVMAKNLETARRECILSELQEKILTGHQKPILLLNKKEGGKICSECAPENPKIGLMLPYAPLQLLLFDYDDGIHMPDCLVMTSANTSGAPICKNDDEALIELGPLCSCILSHNREIRIRADDSVMDFYNGNPYMVRRSRGYAPLPVPVSAGFKGQVLGIGGELKNEFCIGRDDLFYISPYVGDLEDLRTVNALKETVSRFEGLLEADPSLIGCDMHPLYNSTETAKSMKKPVCEIQHHYAHVLSCMAENDYFDKVIGVSFDGTGYGTDGTIWGGEILLSDLNGFERSAHISPFLQIGADLSAKEGWRIAAAMIIENCGSIKTAREAACKDAKSADAALDTIEKLGLCSAAQAKTLAAMAENNINTIRSTSCGRLFDAVSAILGIRGFSTFEGEAANALMFKAMEYDAFPAADHKGDAGVHAHYESELKNKPAAKPSDRLKKANFTASQLRPQNTYRTITDQQYVNPDPENQSSCQANCAPEFAGEHSAIILPTDRLVQNIVEMKLAGADTAYLAYYFHRSLADMITSACKCIKKESNINTVCLTGGVFQNTLLLGMCDDALTDEGFKVLTHHLVPPNDGGIALGQAVYAMNKVTNSGQ